MVNQSGQAEDPTDGSVPPTAEADGSQTTPQLSPKQRRPSSLKLRSLAPEYVEDWHASYVRHLEEAVKDARNRNVALTGRYGAGKSSVLDKFEEKYKNSTVRISINTLGPDNEGEGLTNRIQKEMVKQLVYRAKAGQVRSSRFARTAPLTPERAFWQAFGGTVVVGALLWLVGALPNPAGTGPSHPTAVRVAAWLLFGALSVAVVWVLRWLVGNRIVSGVATAGTSVTLQEQPDTYFDKYLDELVAFFDQVAPDYVIFEDLDRFDDPHIFDSLRELNTLLNSSANRAKDKPPLRFIYAIKDSLFEQLGVNADDEPANKENAEKKEKYAAQPPEERTTSKKVDVAAAATERANRTKFFELVIPMVPFISHRNARDLLLEQLKKRGIREDTLHKPLLGLVARHATDMRLLTNICNEFVVFAERLLWVDRPAPGLTEDHLFALVAYKNFHLADFEDIPARGSTLDQLERYRLDLVRASIRTLQDEKRHLANANTRYRSREETATDLGNRLVSLGEALRQVHASRHIRGLGFVVGDRTYKKEEVGRHDFWEDLARHRVLTILAEEPRYPPVTLLALGADELETQFADGVAADRWAAADERRRQERLTEIDELIPLLRGADFKDLVDKDQFVLKRAGWEQPQPFGALVCDTLQSNLSRDLVRFGYINRNFAEYASVFYGNFTGVDVANFYNRSVQPNTMYLDFKFSGPAAVENLLAEVSADFTSTLSALNLDVVTYLLNKNDSRADEIAAFIAVNFGDEAQDFLETYLNEADLPRRLLVKRLAARPWPRLFGYLVTHPGLPDDGARMMLVDAALRTAAAVSNFEVNDDVAHFLASNYDQMPAFTQDQTEARAGVAFAFAERAGLIVGRLSEIGEPLRTRMITEKMYRLAAENLRNALAKTGGVPLDAVRGADAPPAVWEYCRENIDTFFSAVEEDDATRYAVESSNVLVGLLDTQRESWTREQLTRLVILSAPTSAVTDLTEVSDDLWQLLAARHRLVPTIANLHAYAQTHGIDQHLADFLTSDSELAAVVVHEEDDTDTVVALAVAVLGASPVLDVNRRVALTSALDLRADAIPLSSVAPEGNGFLVLAIEAGLFSKVEEVFDYFLSAGWDAVEDAVARFPQFRALLTPEKVGTVVAALLASDGTPGEVRDSVLSRLDEFVTDTDEPALRAAASTSLRHGYLLPLNEVRRIAGATADSNLVVPLLAQLKGSPTTDVIAVLALLGHPYSLLAGGSGGEFDLPVGESHATVFERLRSAHKVKLVKKGRLSSAKVVKVIV